MADVYHGQGMTMPDNLSHTAQSERKLVLWKREEYHRSRRRRAIGK